jgi:signal transduction histidine kinase
MQTKPIHILVVEDNPTDYAILCQQLLLGGIHTTALKHATTLADTISMLHKETPDLIILDLFLPDSESMHTLTSVNKAAASVPIIILSNASDEESAILSIKMGAQDYLVKEKFDANCLIKSIHYSIERKKNHGLLESRIHDAIIGSQESEKEELGKELHDNINQILASCKLYLEVSITDKKKRDALLPKSFEYLNLAIQEIRKLSKALVAPPFDHVDLGEALADLLECESTSTTTHFTLEDEFIDPGNVRKQLQLIIYRITQEQLQNISKHAKAKNVTIRLSEKDDRIILSIADDGIGFNYDNKSKGIGLRNIRSRVESQKGRLLIISAPGKGCILQAIIPMKNTLIENSTEGIMAI